MGIVDVVVDTRDRVVTWSPAAEALFGHASAAAVGRQLQDLLDGRDVFGNRVCHDGCWLRDTAGAGEAVQRYELDARHAEGRRLRLVVDVQPAAQGWTYRFLADRRAERSRAPAASAATPEPEAACVLTQRERDVLRLLARGAGTAEIAREMRISATTVRNHIQHLLEKLGAHTRLQAVSVALRHGIL